MESSFMDMRESCGMSRNVAYFRNVRVKLGLYILYSSGSNSLPMYILIDEPEIHFYTELQRCIILKCTGQRGHIISTGAENARFCAFGGNGTPFRPFSSQHRSSQGPGFNGFEQQVLCCSFTHRLPFVPTTRAFLVR